jgi:hypothetical protein
VTRSGSNTDHRPVSDQGRANAYLRDEISASGNCGLHEQLIKISTEDGGPTNGIPILGADRRPTGSSDNHAGHRKRSSADFPADTETIEDRERPGIHRVATELVTWKPRTVEETNADPRTRQDDRCNRACRPRPNDQDV